LLRYVGLRAAGLGYVRGVILGREKGVGLGCDLTIQKGIVQAFVPLPSGQLAEFSPRSGTKGLGLSASNDGDPC
jgi:hypothetical protein